MGCAVSRSTTWACPPGQGLAKAHGISGQRLDGHRAHAVFQAFAGDHKGALCAEVLEAAFKVVRHYREHMDDSGVRLQQVLQR